MSVAVLGVVADTVAIYEFIASLFQRQNTNTCNIRVAAALNGGKDGTDSGDGSLDMIRIYNTNQQILGSSIGGYVESGGFKDFSLNQGQRPAGGLCDALGWVGDWGRVCGLDWYYGNVFVDGGKSKPCCTWIDSDHTNGIKASAITIHFPSFADRNREHNAPRSFCGPPAFRAYQGNDGSGPILGRRNTPPDSRLVVSSDPQHLATELCQSETSRGPDFVSTAEGMFCDMQTKTLAKVCTNDKDTGCVKLPDTSVNGTAIVRRGAVEVAGRQYNHTVATP